MSLQSYSGNLKIFPNVFDSSLGPSDIRRTVWKGILWGLFAFLLGAVGALVSFVIGIFQLGMFSLLMFSLYLVPIIIVIGGTIFFYRYGMMRSVAAILVSHESEWSIAGPWIKILVKSLEVKMGPTVSGVSVGEFRKQLKAILRDQQPLEGYGPLSGRKLWMFKKAQGLISDCLQSQMVQAYREEAEKKESAVVLQKIGSIVTERSSTSWKPILFKSLNLKTWLFMLGYLLLAAGWWHVFFVGIFGGFLNLVFS